MAGIAHELNTPIGNAVTVSSTLLDEQRRFSEKVASGLTRSALDRFVGVVGEAGQIVERNLYRAAAPTADDVARMADYVLREARALQELGVEGLDIGRQPRGLELIGDGRGCELGQGDAVQQAGEGLQRRLEGQAARLHGVDGAHQGLHVVGAQGVEHRIQVVVADGAEHVLDGLLLHFAGAVGDGLVEQR